MLGWAITFLVIAIIAAVFGFGGIAASAGIAKLLFFVFLVMCVIFFLLGWRGRGAPATGLSNCDSQNAGRARNYAI